MAQDPKAGPAQPGQKRQQGTRVFWVYEYQRIRMPTLINHMPVKIRRAHMGMGVRSGFSPQRVSRNSPLPSGQKKFPTEELHDIQGALWQIKAQVDSLLQSLERMDRQQVPPVATKDSGKNRGPGSKGSSCSSEPPQKPRSEEAGPEADGYEGGTDTEWTVKNHAEDQASQEAAGTPPASSAPGILDRQLLALRRF
ncbi:RNA-binding Raly-like protein [Macaca nemestrina]|uniref:RNA-binding Raly-like protein n=1 Tax=Macaca nemestrina TaxID=9545 RepID=UPI0039B89A77